MENALIYIHFYSGNDNDGDVFCITFATNARLFFFPRYMRCNQPTGNLWIEVGHSSSN